MLRKIEDSPLFLLAGLALAAWGGFHFYRSAVVPHLQARGIGA